MSEDTSDLTVTLKAGSDFSAPWIVVRGNTPDEVKFKLQSLDGVIEATLEAAGAFAAGRSLGKPEVNSAPAQQEQPKQQGWGSSPAAQQQNTAPPQRQYNDVPHPEGKTCGICPNVLVKKKSQGGKEKWQCPEWRWNGGNPNGHGMEWIGG